MDLRSEDCVSVRETSKMELRPFNSVQFVVGGCRLVSDLFML